MKRGCGLWNDSMPHMESEERASLVFAKEWTDESLTASSPSATAAEALGCSADVPATYS